MIEEQLISAFPVKVRQELCASLRIAYQQAFEASLQFGPFATRALGYAQHFYSDALLAKAAQKLKLNHTIGKNRAKNTPHLLIRSDNWQMTPHRLSRGRQMPVNAVYRAHYSLTNDMFADSTDEELAAAHGLGYVYLLHSGEKSLEFATLTVPDRLGTRPVHNEFLDAHAPLQTDVEEIDDMLDEGIKIRVEQAIRKSG